MRLGVPELCAAALSCSVVALGCMPDVSGQIEKSNQMVAAAQANAAQAMQIAATGQVSGSMTVNSAPYAPIRCGAGQASGFSGVDVFGNDGSRVRFVSEVDGTSSVIYFSPAAGGAGATMKGCATLNVRPTGVILNGVPQVSGNVQLDCKNDAVHLAGMIAFTCG